MTARAAILFLTHTWNRLIRLKFERLQREIGGLADVFLLMQKSAAADDAARDDGAIRRALTVFDTDSMPAMLGYPYTFDSSMLPGSLHFVVLAFSQKLVFSHYFLIENDVEYSGNWGDLVAGILDLSPDFASSHIFGARDRPSWGWWRAYRPSEGDRDWAMDPANLRRSFNPIYCLSREGAELVHAAHRNGWRGHQEMILPTILTRRGCKVVDLHSTGMVIGNEQDPVPGRSPSDLSTVRWRPNVGQSEFRDRTTGRTLFHPVKDNWYFDGTAIVTVEEA